MERLFFGYGAKPDDIRRTMSSLAARLGELNGVESSVSWEDLKVDGRLIVNEIESHVSKSSICVFDLTVPNLNVLFELGLAIGLKRRVVLLQSSAFQKASKRVDDEVPLLSTVGYTRYANEDELLNQMISVIGHEAPPLWNDVEMSISANLDDSCMLYVPSAQEDNASRRLSRTLERFEKLNSTTISFEDYGSMPLAWYVEQIYRCGVAVFHMTPSNDYLAALVNPRVALLAGIARGIGRNTLIVAPQVEETAVDYRDMSIRYSNPPQLERLVLNWLDSLPDASTSRHAKVRTELKTELSWLRFGNHVAESDRDGLEYYFVRTSDYQDVVTSAATIFTGKKGTGKTANMLTAADELRLDPRNLVCVIKPASYELDGLTEVLRRIDKKHLDNYLIEGLWKYLLYTEIAAKTVAEAESRPAGIATGSPEDRLRRCLEEKHEGVGSNFSDRLESLVDSLAGVVNSQLDSASIKEARSVIDRALHGTAIKDLRQLIGDALSGRQRVAILVDNLDKAWERGADLDLLAQLLLGLLGVVGRVVDEFRREKNRKSSVNVTLTVFLRSDIFAFIRDKAREPDKISVAEIEWRDPDLLIRVLEDRFKFNSNKDLDPRLLWDGFFAPAVRGLPSRDYLLSRVQARPRDLVFFANAAVNRASNAKHQKIEESDILEAEKSYSQFAYEALLVEGVAAGMDLEEILIEFAGENPILDFSRIEQILGPLEESHLGVPYIVESLRRLGFLGVETSDGSFDYGGTDGEMKRANVLARKLEKGLGRPARYEVHTAYRRFLEIDG
ncbi:hypothetical protein QRX60_19895 [Amycolatopsis mongoliensis]|uniref:Uncharacterized protein n=1 Tax=Amycolatopsis mongoliensis TaxID=715475 RepID=A0A9Y2JZT7_9PSEU|nr:hypothetical protein [Amycolatopsis sp. 4-36]WIY05989.1 hypothetical protein QRX60_19895 [Amycolatopsis sp. 4-36]